MSIPAWGLFEIQRPPGRGGKVHIPSPTPVAILLTKAAALKAANEGGYEARPVTVSW